MEFKTIKQTSSAISCVHTVMKITDTGISSVMLLKNLLEVTVVSNHKHLCWLFFNSQGSLEYKNYLFFYTIYVTWFFKHYRLLAQEMQVYVLQLMQNMAVIRSISVPFHTLPFYHPPAFGLKSQMQEEKSRGDATKIWGEVFFSIYQFLSLSLLKIVFESGVLTEWKVKLQS